ncbi:hypothetical protein [Vibrio cincinnatiensis]|uniref:hypothetical protein n=1 Tax=Vibrio cincinnatiensis TaxID=675 RepID=UPI001EE09A22|nr:hypothetical protein [Vibrio cincinnatiensis]MCG3727326.1 hypothetical protein [Vibrio cincinnatiensis]
MGSKTIFDEWDINSEYFTTVVRENPSLRGMILGYIAERKLKDIFISSGETTNHRKEDDHDRTKKGDLTLNYKGYEIVLEVKSLQTNQIKIQAPDGSWIPMIIKKSVGRKPSKGFNKYGTPKIGQIIYKYVPNPDFLAFSDEYRLNATYMGAFQCDASDRRKIELDNGEIVNTTLLKVGEFDVIAAGIFSFRNKWESGFALNEDLPRSSRYGENSSHLIASLVQITYPLEKPFVSDPFEIFERVITKRKASLLDEY